MGAVWSFLSGEGATRKQGAFYKAYKINDQLGQKLQAVGIGKKQLYELHEIFNRMDRDNSGEINLSEFFIYVDIKRTRFSEKAFTVMDRNGSGEIDFIEFVLAVWNYCSFSRASLVRYAFDLFDSDGSGEIELNEASQCVREIWGSDWERNAKAQKIMAKLEGIIQSNPTGRMTIQMFQDFSQRHPMLLFPAFQLQTEIQHRVLGERFWHKAAKRRSLIDPREFNFDKFEKLVQLSPQSSQNLVHASEDALHDHIFEEITSAPAQASAPPPRKRSSVQNVLVKVRSRKSKVFLEAKKSSGREDESRVSPKRTSVTAFESTAQSPTAKRKESSPSPTAKRKDSAAKRASTTQLSPLAPARRSISSFESTKPGPAATASFGHDDEPTSPKKKKKAKSPEKNSDLVVEEVVEDRS